MASRNIKKLAPEMQEKAQQVIQLCNEAGVDLLIYCTLRSLEEQAKLYRQSRSRSKIDAKIAKFRDRGFSFLADIFENVGPCSGPHVTNAAPGESWHNYAEAWDGVPLEGGKALWNYEDAKEQWGTYGQSVRQVEINWAGDWQNFTEYPHTQLRQGGNPLKLNTPDKIREILVNNGLLSG